MGDCHPRLLRSLYSVLKSNAEMAHYFIDHLLCASPTCQKRENEGAAKGVKGGGGVMAVKGRGKEGRERGEREIKVCWREGK